MATAQDFAALKGSQQQIQYRYDENGNPQPYIVVNGQAVPLQARVDPQTGQVMSYYGQGQPLDATGANGGDVSTWGAPQYTLDASGNMVDSQFMPGTRNGGATTLGLLGPLLVGGAAGLAGAGAGAAAEGGAAAGSGGWGGLTAASYPEAVGAAGSAAGGAAGGTAGGWATGAGLDGVAGDTAYTYGVGNGLASGAGVTGAAAGVGGGVGAGGGAVGGGAGGVGGATTAGGTGGALSRVLAGTGTASDYASLGMTAAGAVAGAAGSRSGTTQTQTQTIDPLMRDYITQYMQRSSMLSGQPTTAYGGQLGAPTDGMANAAAFQQGMIGQAADAVNAGMRPGTSAANAQLGSVQGLLGQATAAGTATKNGLLGLDNPELQRQIDLAQGDLARNYNNVVAASFNRGSSFGNSGLADQELQSRYDLEKNMGAIGSGMRYNNYALQANLGESAAQRQDAINAAQRQAQLSGAGLLGNLGESAAGRTDAMFNSNAGRALQGGNALANFGAMPFQSQAALQQANASNNQAAYQEFLRQYQDPFQKLQAFGSPIGANMGGSTSVSSAGSPWAGAFGGGLLASQMFGGKSGSSWL